MRTLVRAIAYENLRKQYNFKGRVAANAAGDSQKKKFPLRFTALIYDIAGKLTTDTVQIAGIVSNFYSAWVKTPDYKAPTVVGGNLFQIGHKLEISDSNPKLAMKIKQEVLTEPVIVDDDFLETPRKETAAEKRARTSAGSGNKGDKKLVRIQESPGRASGES